MNRRNPGRKRDTGRDPGGFCAIPWSVLDSPAYMELPHPAKALLMEIARQYRGGDNGRLLVTNKYMATRGWKSPQVIHRAKRELLEAGMIFETCKGMRPNKASWFALTWRSLDRNDGYDQGVLAAFERGAYRRNANTSPVLVRTAIGTSHVLERAAPSTSPVPIQPVFERAPSTSPVLPLDVAISGARIEAAEGAEVGEVDLDRGVKLTGAQPEKTKPCQYPGCGTLTLGRQFCAKHRHLAIARMEANG